MAEAPPPGVSRTTWIAVTAVIVVIVVIVAALALTGFFAPGDEEDQTIRIGTILPTTGTLGWLGAPMEDASDLAAEQINAAGGVLGKDIELIHCDSQTRPAQGANCAAKLVYTDRVVAIVGAASSGVSQLVSTITLEQEVVLISPASTSPLFTTFEIERQAALVAAGAASASDPVPDEDIPGWFWRTAPSDKLQSQVAGLLAVAEGWQTFGVLAVNNPYGKGFSELFTDVVVAAGKTVKVWVNYTEEQVSYASDLQLIANADVDAVFAIAYPGDGLTMMQNWEAKTGQTGWGWDWFWSEGLKSNVFLEELATANIDVAGIKGTAPLPPAANFQIFEDAYTAKFDRPSEVFDPHTYDAVYLVAAAIEMAGEATSDAVRLNLVDVSSGTGTTVLPGEWDDILTEIADGNSINYEGASGGVDLNFVGEPLSDYEIWEITGTIAAGFAYTLRETVICGVTCAIAP
ncbi:MAG: ABC transporter substrate-binding protein [Thermoplasmata archaeon]